MKLQRLIRVLAMAMTLSACASRSESAAPIVRGQPVVQIRLDSIRAKIPKSGFPELSKAPNRYLTDFFGVLRLNPELRASHVLRDLVPAHARVVSADSTLRLEFKDGSLAEFYFDGGVQIEQQQPIRGLNFVVLPNALNSGDAAPHVDRLLQLLQQNGLAERYLAPNPFFAEELSADSAMKQAARAIATVEPGGYDAFAREANAVLLVADRVHGDVKRYDEFVALMRRPEVQWIAIEMLSTDLQQAARDYTSARAGSSEYNRAREALFGYYRGAWNDRFGAVEAPEQNHYFRLIELARELEKPVYALDTSLEYVVFRYGEFPLGATTRNVIWAKQLPSTGRGLIFGGSGHMMRMPGNIQFFLRQLRPQLKIFDYDPPRS